jgi:hypothetical protein
VITGPPWLFRGAYANYTGIETVFGMNYTEDVNIKVVQFTQTMVEYNLTASYPSGFVNHPSPESFSTTEWLNISESSGRLLCQYLSSPRPVNMTVSGKQIAATSYNCFVGPNDYGVVYLGWSVPFILYLSHTYYPTLCCFYHYYGAEWTITSSNIPGLLAS